MLKLLYKPTGNIFTLPDAEAIKIKNNDRGNDYLILEAGLQKEEVAKVSQEEVASIESSKTKEKAKDNKKVSKPKKNSK